MSTIISFFKISFADKQNRLNFALILLTLIGLLILSTGKSESKPAAEVDIESDALIPEGSVLVPLDLQNRDALNDLVGAFATVDLFTVSEDGQKKGTKVAKRVKLIRSPQNPTQFSALVPEDQASLLFANPGPLFAVIQSRQTKKSSSVIGKSKSTSRIRILSSGAQK